MERLVDAIKEGEVVRISESQALKEDLFILKRFEQSSYSFSPQEQVSESLKGRSNEMQKPANAFESWKRGDLQNKNNVVNDLVKNFHWEIATKRKSRGISRAKLAQETKISEEDLRIIEMGRLPYDDFIYISKIENYLGINLRKNKNSTFSLAQLQKKREEKIIPRKEDNQNKDLGISNRDILGSDIEIID